MAIAVRVLHPVYLAAIVMDDAQRHAVRAQLAPPGGLGLGDLAVER